MLRDGANLARLLPPPGRLAGTTPALPPAGVVACPDAFLDARTAGVGRSQASFLLPPGPASDTTCDCSVNRRRTSEKSPFRVAKLSQAPGFPGFHQDPHDSRSPFTVKSREVRGLNERSEGPCSNRFRLACRMTPSPVTGSR